MIKSRTHSERWVVVADVVLVVAVADGDHSGHDHGHVYDHDPLRLSRDLGAACAVDSARRPR
jgi:hypothetical protein